jgi:glutathione S-transferase
VITLYQFELSPFCDKIRRILNYKRLAYDVENVSLMQTLTRMRDISPRTRKLPALEYHGKWLHDSTAIAHFLEREHPEPPLVPRAPRERGLCHMLEDWADESLYFVELYLRFTLPHNARRWVPRLAAYDHPLVQSTAPIMVPRHYRGVLDKQGLGKKAFAMVLEDLQRHVGAVDDWLAGGDYLVGEALSLADIAVYAQLHCIAGTEEGERELAGHPRVLAWMERVAATTAAPGSRPDASPARATGT